jgi:GAF domain-containing protein
MGKDDRLYNSIIIRTFVKFIQSRYSFVSVGELLAAAGMQNHQVEDDAHWFTQDQVDQFHEVLVKMTGNRNIAREAGRHTSSKEAMSPLTRYGLGFAGPARVFEMIGEITRRYTKSARYQSRRTSRTEFELIVTPHEGVNEKEYQCQNRIGYFEAIVQVFNSRLPRIEHEECVFHGGSSCRYRVTWHESRAESWKTVRNFAAAASFVAIPLLFLVAPAAAALTVTGILVFGVLSIALFDQWLEKKEMKSALDSLRSSTDELMDSVNQNYQHALMVNEIGRIIGKYIQTDKLLPQVIDTLQRRLDYDRGLILLASADKSRLEYRTGFGYSEETVVSLLAESFNLDNPDSRGVFVLCHREQRPYLINDVEEIQKDLSDRSRRFLRKIGSKSFLCCPILYEDECLGVLAVDNVRSKRPLLESDINLLMGIAPEIAISLHNALVTDEREEQFQSVIRTLAASIDTRDNLTAGHSARVTDFAVAICREMGLDSGFTEVIRVAAQLHDYGKIGIKDSILKKEGPLTEDERREIETHAAKSEEILSQIKFYGEYQQVPYIAGSHHERLDGGGYPRGLKGDEIPFGARIIAVADFFEAITAQRHYRDPMSFEQAVELLKRESGPHLEPAIVETFLKIVKPA